MVQTKLYTLLSVGMCFLLFGVSLSAQSLGAYKRAAEEAYGKGDYYNAVKYYEQVVSSKPKQKAEFYYHYGESARKASAWKQAELAYKYVMENDEKSEYPVAPFFHAQALKHNGAYTNAAVAFQSFANSYAQNDFYKAKALQEAKSCNWAAEMYRQPDKDIAIEALNKEINTEYSDFGAHLLADSLYYSSLRFEGQPTDASDKSKLGTQPKKLTARLLVAPNDSTQGEVLEALSGGDEHTANSTMSPDGKRIYYSRCRNIRPDSMVCAIWLSRKGDDGTWGRARPLPSPVNLENCDCSTTQPHLSIDEETGREFLFFASNRLEEGAQGGMDIWMVELFNNGFNYGLAKNLGEYINTPEDEATPFFHAKTKTLYFSSEWHEGFGGFDMFKSQRRTAEWDQWYEPENLGAPLNSAANDLYFYLAPGDSLLYFASNRTGSMTISGESCCNDIYKTVLPEPRRPAVPGEEPPVAQVDPPKKTTPSEPTKPSEPVVTTTPSEPTKPSEPVATTTPSEPTKPSEPVATTTPSEPTKPSEPGQITTTETTVSTDPPRKVITPEPNVPISPDPFAMTEEEKKKKMQELNQMLPLRLYFHNDEPDSNTTAKTTLKSYEIPYREYIDRKEEYMESYGGQFKVELQGNAMSAVDEFFEMDVKGEYNRMNAFFDKILELLDNGMKLEIHIKGYTSPRSNERYNEALAHRRVMSVRKQLFVYRSGLFMEHFQKGNFTVKELPIGELQAPAHVSDNMEDPANSIYSVDASRERRAEIMVLRKKQD